MKNSGVDAVDDPGTVEIMNVWKKYKSTRDGASRQHLIVSYVSLVKIIAGRIGLRSLPGVDFDDLVNYGIIGLIDAIEKFDLEKGIKFETYAASRIRGAILDALRKHDWIPRSTRQKARHLERVYSEVENRLGRAATDSEIASELGIAVDELSRVLAEVSNTFLMSFDEVAVSSDDEEGQSVVTGVRDRTDKSPEERAVYASSIGTLTKALGSLPEREKLVVSLYYYDELTLKEIGEVLGVTESRVSQLHTKAILRLRGKLSRARSNHAI